METKQEIKLYKDAGFEVKDVRTEKTQLAEVERLRREYGVLHKVTADDVERNTNSNTNTEIKEGEWIVVPNNTETSTQSQTKPSSNITKSVEAKDDVSLFFRGKAVVRTENRVQNGRVYKHVETVDAFYLISEDEYTKDLTTK